MIELDYVLYIQYIYTVHVPYIQKDYLGEVIRISTGFENENEGGYRNFHRGWS